MTERESIERAIITDEELAFEVQYHRSLSARIAKVQGYLEEAEELMGTLAQTMHVLNHAVRDLTNVWNGEVSMRK